MSVKITEGPWKGWMQRDCGIQFDHQVYFYYPEFVTVQVNDEDKRKPGLV